MYISALKIIVDASILSVSLKIDVFFSIVGEKKKNTYTRRCFRRVAALIRAPLNQQEEGLASFVAAYTMFNFTRGSKERTTIGIDDKKKRQEMRASVHVYIYVINLI